MRKIKGKKLVISCWLIVIGLLIYTRFVGLNWGLPYPMHPDERNMANAIQQLSCKQLTINNQQFPNKCFNPHFFAYGQFPLYSAYLMVYFFKFVDGNMGTLISYQEAVISLRIISAIASLFNVLVLIKIVNLLVPQKATNYKFQVTSLLIFIFSPFFIQFSHFGTTESLIMLFNSLIIYYCIKYIQEKLLTSLLLSSIFSGLAIASKVSSVIFLAVPIITIIYVNTISMRPSWKWLKNVFFSTVKLLATSLIIFIIFSPHNFINFNDFLGALRYESDVALGSYRAFYTRQFDNTVPVIFQILKIFPYALGWPVFIFSILGFLFLPYNSMFNLLRLAFLISFMPNSLLYAKWSRFMAPIFPLMVIFAVLFLLKIKVINIIKIIIIIISIIPGIAYLSVYQNPDVRFQASEWIYKNIPDKSYILSETANVVDLPILASSFERPASSYEYISFNFYDLDENPILLPELQEHFKKADYIFVPSRRLFANYYCKENFQSIFNDSIFKFRTKCDYLREKYPFLNDYYDKLFSGELGFQKVAEFSQYPKIQLFGKTILEFPDEEAEETWTVFNHPVFRIYKRVILSQ